MRDQFRGLCRQRGGAEERKMAHQAVVGEPLHGVGRSEALVEECVDREGRPRKLIAQGADLAGEAREAIEPFDRIDGAAGSIREVVDEGFAEGRAERQHG